MFEFVKMGKSKKFVKKIKSSQKNTFCGIIGRKRALKLNVLPTNRDVLRQYLCLDGSKPFSQLVVSVIEVWRSAEIPTVGDRRVMDCVVGLHKQYRHLKKQYNARNKGETMQQKIKAFATELSKLFDISACKCKESCLCNVELSENQRRFLIDQRSSRELTFKHLKENEIEELLADNVLDETIENISFDDHLEDTMSMNSFDDSAESVAESYDTSDGENDPDYEVVAAPKYNDLNLTPVALVADRFGVSHPATAAIVTATLQMVGLVTDSDQSLVVDEHKVKRSRDKLRNELRDRSAQDQDGMIALYFDGRKDKTLYMERGADLVYRQKCKKEEHVSLIAEPGGNYIGHVSLVKGSAENIEKRIYESVNNSYSAVGCDGTVVNTGTKGGVIRLTELRSKTPKQWLICQLHLNELPLRELFTLIDGPTKGPSAFSGPIGSSLKSSVQLPLVKYKKIPSNLPVLHHDMKTNELSTDQRYLYEMCQAVSSGVCSESLAVRNPGKICQSRWLTLANNSLRKYVGTLKPTKELKDFVTFILKVYAPTWFTIKINNKCVNGAANLLYLIKASRYLPLKYRIKVDESIQRNAYFAHHENILLGMLHDSREDIRKLACQRILHARKSINITVRRFTIPTLNFKAKEYYTLIDWTKTKVTEPPLTKNFTEAELIDLVQNGENSKLWEAKIFQLPCHTQNTERCVKLVTEVSTRVADEIRRDGYIRTVLASRAAMPKFQTKKDFRITT